MILPIFSYVAVVIDTDGSAFITKAEFDSLKNNFQSQIDNYNSSIDSKIDGAIASYLSGIKLSNLREENVPLAMYYSAIESIGKDNPVVASEANIDTKLLLSKANLRTDAGATADQYTAAGYVLNLFSDGAFDKYFICEYKATKQFMDSYDTYKYSMTAQDIQWGSGTSSGTAYSANYFTTPNAVNIGLQYNSDLSLWDQTRDVLPACTVEYYDKKTGYNSPYRKRYYGYMAGENFLRQVTTSNIQGTPYAFTDMMFSLPYTGESNGSSAEFKKAAGFTDRKPRAAVRFSRQDGQIFPTVRDDCGDYHYKVRLKNESIHSTTGIYSYVGNAFYVKGTGGKATVTFWDRDVTYSPTNIRQYRQITGIAMMLQQITPDEKIYWREDVVQECAPEIISKELEIGDGIPLMTFPSSCTATIPFECEVDGDYRVWFSCEKFNIDHSLIASANCIVPDGYSKEADGSFVVTSPASLRITIPDKKTLYMLFTEKNSDGYGVYKVPKTISVEYSN